MFGVSVNDRTEKTGQVSIEVFWILVYDHVVRAWLEEAVRLYYVLPAKTQTLLPHKTANQKKVFHNHDFGYLDASA